MKVVLKKFRNTFKTNDQIISIAGGRAELIGGHTDYNDGFVIAAAIDKSFSVAARARSDKKIIMFSGWAKESFEFELSKNIKSTDKPKWANYGIGVTVLLAKADLLSGGADILITGDVPVGAGLCGGGFGGAAVALAENKSSQKIKEKVFADYKNVLELTAKFMLSDLPAALKF